MPDDPPAADGPADDPEALRRQIEELQRKLAESEAASGGDSGSRIGGGDHNIAAGAESLVIGGSVFGDVNVTVAKPGAVPARKLLASYLLQLIESTRFLKLEVIDEESAVRSGAQIHLNAVYTDLDTTAATIEFENGNPSVEEIESRLTESNERLSALEFASVNPHAVLLGLPGSGKTTFTEMLALCLAGEILKRDDINLSLLGDDWAAEAGASLPVCVTLREFAARAAASEKPYTLWNHIAAKLGDGLPGFDDLLRKHLIETGGLIILDGLDEVSETGDCRSMVKEAVLQLKQDFPLARILVTSRTYAYQRQDWKLPGFEAAELAPFDQDHWNAFVDRWYAELAGIRKKMSPESAAVRAGELKEAIASRPHLQELAARPLLLTLMAALHALRGGTLPREREQLYERTFSLLLDVWEKPKTVHDSEGNPVVQTESAAEFLEVNRDEVERALEQIAYEVHAEQGHKKGVADIPEGTLLAGLNAVAVADRKNPSLLAEYVRDRAGILTHAGEGIYQFPHRTFQEYLAARYLSRTGFPDKLAGLVREDPERWREVYLLAGAKAARGAPYAAWSLLRKTCPEVVPKAKRKIAAVPDNEWIAASLAGHLILETGVAPDPEILDDDETALRGRIIEWLATLVSLGKLPAPDRAEAGIALGHLGDPRDGVTLDRDGLPDIDWIEIPDGTLLYGEEKEVRTIDQPFKIGRYLVTVSQFQAFVDADGYESKKWWKKYGGWARRSENEVTGPESYSAVSQTPNHPRVGVNWYEAGAFCEWLTSRSDETISLPTEAQWVRAARHTDGREYPWGEWSDDSPQVHANMSQSNVGHTTSVGLFPIGNAICGAADLSGNVWEWCVDSIDLIGKGDGRVLRGGAFDHTPLNVRCAFRVRYSPDSRLSNFGFRVVSSP